MLSKRLKKAASFWDRNVRLHEYESEVFHWLDSPLVSESVLKKLKVDDRTISVVWWLQWVKEKYAQSSILDHGLSICCGDGTLERHALVQNICSRFDAYDISRKSIENALKQSKAKGMADRITYYIEDVNKIKLNPMKYDIIFSGMALHHIHNLEHVLAELQKSLTENGLFILNEYVGPSQFQWTDRQLNVIKNILAILPDRLKYDPRSKVYKNQCTRPSIEDMNAMDPSEAIRSSEIIPLVYKTFNVVERIDYGGTILHMLLDGIICNFNPEKEEDVAILQLIGYLEDSMIQAKVLNSDFSIIVATK